jgi:hypothetical protein
LYRYPEAHAASAAARAEQAEFRADAAECDAEMSRERADAADAEIAVARDAAEEQERMRRDAEVGLYKLKCS